MSSISVAHTACTLEDCRSPFFLKEREGTFGENKKGNSKKDIFKLPDIHSAMFVYLASFMTPSM